MRGACAEGARKSCPFQGSFRRSTPACRGFLDAPEPPDATTRIPETLGTVARTRLERGGDEREREEDERQESTPKHSRASSPRPCALEAREGRASRTGPCFLFLSTATEGQPLPWPTCTVLTAAGAREEGAEYHSTSDVGFFRNLFIVAVSRACAPRVKKAFSL